jgi:hypothetical protein
MFTTTGASSATPRPSARSAIIKRCPVFNYDIHPVVGVGFTFERLQSFSDVQLPYALQEQSRRPKRDLKNSLKELTIHDRSGVVLSKITSMINVNSTTPNHLLDPWRLSL